MTRGPATKEALGRFLSRERLMAIIPNTGKAPDLIAAMTALVSILDGEGHLLAAAYVSIAIELLERPDERI